jgi:hypothetical protein
MHLRSWVPTFVYVVPVTFSAALLQTLYALLFEINSFESKQALVVGNSGGFGSDLGVIFGWLRPEYRWRVLYLGVVPGVLGHTNFNMLLRYTVQSVHVRILSICASICAYPPVIHLLSICAYPSVQIFCYRPISSCPFVLNCVRWYPTSGPY